MAARRSLSPNLISSTLMVSFSLMIGTAFVFEQGVQRVPHVQVAGPAVEVLVREQELGGVAAVPAQALVVGPDQVRLADRGGGLELRQVVGPSLQAELADPRADGARADQGDLAARVHHGADLLGQVVDSGRVERPSATGQDAGPDLDDPDSRGEDDLVADQVADDGLRPRRSAALAELPGFGSVELGRSDSLFKSQPRARQATARNAARQS